MMHNMPFPKKDPNLKEGGGDMKNLRKIIILSLLTIAITSCGEKKDPLSKLSEIHKEYLFGNGRIAFLGKPINGTIDCNFQNSNQGYVFKKVGDDIYIDSLRPSGTIDYKLVEAISSGHDIDIIAVNATNNKSDINFSNIVNDRVQIDFGGEDKSLFLRCEK